MKNKTSNIISTEDLKKVGKIIFNNIPLFVSFLLIASVSAYLYSYKLPKIYSEKTQLVLNSEQTYSYRQGLFSGLGVDMGYEKISNERNVLTSTDLISQTISKLSLDVSYFIVGRIQIKEVYSGTPFVVESKIYSNRFYEMPIMFKILNVDEYEISFEKEDGKQTTVRHNFGEPILNNDFYFLINKTAVVNKATAPSFADIKYQFEIHNRENLVYSYKNSISVENIDYTAILEISLENASPERAKMFLDTLAKVYMDNSLKTKFKINENTIRDIDKTSNQIMAILDSIENIREDFKESKNILNLSKEEATYYDRLTDFESKKRQLDLQLKAVNYLKEYITSNLNKELLPPSVLVEGEDAYLTKAIGELYNYQVQINTNLFATTEKSTVVKEIEYRIELLRNDILKYLVNTEKAIYEKGQALSGEINYYEGLLKGVPKNQRAILNIERKLTVNEKLYSYLQEKRAETVIARSSIVPDIAVIESPHSVGIVKPKLKNIYYSFIVVGLLIAFAIALIKAMFFGTISNIEELRSQTSVPVLGEIFYTKDAKNSYLVVDSQPRSFITESFRAIRTNLEYLASGEKCKTLLITSNRPGVGKTFCSVNLSTILAKGGKKVLLLEMDMHKPKLHTVFKTTSANGMSSLLIGKSTPSDSIIKTEIENLDIIQSGPAPPNASELILSKNLDLLLEHAKNNYDYIVIDTPPMGLISDALMLMKNSDINLFILNTKFGPVDGMQYAHGVLENNKIKSFGFVLNNVKPKHSKYYNKNYKYSYGYGYTQES